MTTDDLVQFADELPAGALPQAVPGTTITPVQPWRVLIVDDDDDVHQATEFALAGLDILGRQVDFLHAYSALDAIDLLMQESDVAVILLDVVMESEDAGLAAVTTIRRDLGLTNTQIILRTGQPGYAPEIETIRRYDINDYRTKSELSRVKLYTALTAAARAYDQLCRMDADRHALETIIDAGNRLLDSDAMARFAAVLLERAAVLLDVPCHGAVVSRTSGSEYLVTGVAGEMAVRPGDTLEQLSQQAEDAASLINEAYARAHTLIDGRGAALYFPSARNAITVAYLRTDGKVVSMSRQMVDVFCSTVALCGENAQLVHRLSDLAFNDALTGLASRRAFAVELDRRLAALPRADTAIVVLDLDQFAEINDMFGHRYGDKLLCAFAERLRALMPQDVMLARLAGDTFGLLGLPEQLTPERWRKALGLPFAIDDQERGVSFASALVAADEVPGEAFDLIKDATIVIKHAKSRGLGRHAEFDPEHSALSRERSKLLLDLGAAFRRRNLFLEYQPQVSLADGTARGVEALLRWRDDTGRLVPPDRFVPIAEHSGLIVPIGYWVIETALAAMARLRAAGHGDLRMAINVSPQQFKHDDFADRLCDLVERAGIPPGSFEIEVTEGMEVLGIADVAATLERIRQRGIAVAIDDFGTGYSSLSYLDQLRADRLKIDRVFVATMGSRPGAGDLARTIIALGQQMHMVTLAEGVENADQADALRQLGCVEAQGFHYARPMLLDDLLAWIGARSPRRD